MTSQKYPVLHDAVDGHREIISGRAGPLSLYSAGAGDPILLLHSINAAASVAEMAPLFDHLRNSRRVFAVDLPGFGFSDRSPRRYDINLYVNAILDVLDHIAEQTDATEVDAVALSLTCEFLARAAARQPRRIRSLTLITPTGFRAGSEQLREPEGSTRFMPALNAILTFALWRSALYRALVSPRSIRYFLRRSFGSRDVDEGLARYCDITTHQPGAEHAPYAFLSGALFSKDIRTIYESLMMPVFMPHGTRGDFSDFSAADWTQERTNWRVTPYASGALPQFECRTQLCADLDHFLSDAAAGRQASMLAGRHS